MQPRANAPEERWQDLQNHFDAFGFNDSVMKEFGVTICNDPFINLSEIDGERVAKPSIAYRETVHVDDEKVKMLLLILRIYFLFFKRDWKAQDKQFVDPATIDHIVFVLVAGYTRNFEEECNAMEFVARQFMERCRDKGMKIGHYETERFKGERGADQFLNNVFKKIVGNPRSSNRSFTPFVLFVSDDVPNIHGNFR